jgi:uncharacterized membrane protein
MRVMKIVIIICISFISISKLFSQNLQDSVKVENILGPEYRQNGITLSRDQLMYIVSSNEEASREINVAQTCRNSAHGLVIIGSVFLGWNIVRYVTQRQANLYTTGLGAVFIILAIPMSSASNKHLLKAVKIYNSGLKPSASWNRDLLFGFSPNGIGIYKRF